jgi:rhodanese-related sulfurtransferase
MRTGVQRCEPDQLRHSIDRDATVRAVDVQPDEVAELQRRGGVQVIDVREDYEWDAGRIPGARHVPLSAVAAEAGSIDRETPVVFVCRVGGRSAMAAQAFRRAGYDAYNLDGGMVAWAGHGLPLDPPDGAVADH